ncbi:OmpP1/FadL family transporter [Biformimicrobium ophioploci]|uniref:Outer membrane protein transport protein n=1 Tax=Biformimicrobium ophioploci TaxID=3036711 RepID=A0ABQ6M2H7_9GAMM|nr:OmpP1/FadL family transporter [Microbulbifer sp. NKW57]GMG88556.1 outer membrane protein transport protein [Microbulbifer sp. NKW57]
MKAKTMQRAILAAAISAVSCHTLAAGFQLQEHSSAGLGRAFAAENTIGDTAAIVIRNPAGSALFEDIAISGGFNYVNPNISARGEVSHFLDFETENGVNRVPLGALVPGYEPFITSGSDYVTDAFVPNFSIAGRIDDCWTWGFGAFSNYGLESDFSSGFGALEVADKASILAVNLAPSIAYSWDNFSVGLSLNALYGEGEFRTSVPFNDANPFFTQGGFSGGERILDYENDGDWDFSWTIGFLWQFDEHSRLGFSYQDGFDFEADGDIRSDLNSLIDLASADLTIDIPGIWELGFYHRFNDEWGFAAGVMYTEWDDFQELVLSDVRTQVNNPVTGERIVIEELTLKEEDFESNWRASFGLEWYPCPEVTWRAGFAWDEGTAQAGLRSAESLGDLSDISYRTLSIPDTDRWWVSFGGTYRWDQNFSIDAGFSYLWGDDESVIEEFSFPVDPVNQPGVSGTTRFDGGTTETEAWLFGVNFNYTF